MVKVIYIPPPFGPGTALNRPGFGPGSDRPWIVKLSKMPQGRVLAGSIALAMAISTIPMFIFGRKLPPTMTPEYEAATRAYMRYHNMNPIFGESSRKGGH